MNRFSRWLHFVALALLAGAVQAQAPGAPAAPLTPQAGVEMNKPEPADELTADVLYRILVGDVAMQRGDAALAARAYFEAARDAQDAVLARRAAEVALFARQRALALESARLWQQLDPTADRARQMVVALAMSGAGGDLKAELQRVLIEAAANDKSLADAFLQLNQALAGQEDKTAAFRLVQELAKPYPNVAEAWFAVALAAYNTKLVDPDIAASAAAAVDRALALKPGWDRAALLKTDILARRSPAEAIDFLKAFLAATPDSRPVAGALAQLYVEQKRFGEARDVFQRLWQRNPDDREFEFAVAAISLQMKDYPTAQRLLEELDKVGYGEKGVVAFYRAQLAEETRQYDDAIARYREVTEGDRAWQAKLRIGAVMAKKGDAAAARRYFDDLQADSNEERVDLAQAKAQLARDAGDYQEAYAILSAALAQQNSSVDLLYDVAMAAEKLDRIDEVEARLKRLIELKPDNAQALNALGYTLVDRTPRAAEGLKLIEQALKLAPSDPFILDSMGWANYRLGNLDDSEKYLRRAFNDQADPEIAAHLGEVLWAKGERDGARKVWQSALKSTPDNPVLIETMRRLAH